MFVIIVLTGYLLLGNLDYLSCVIGARASGLKKFSKKGRNLRFFEDARASGVIYVAS